jgi:hypothetical protein
MECRRALQETAVLWIQYSGLMTVADANSDYFENEARAAKTGECLLAPHGNSGIKIA